MRGEGAGLQRWTKLFTVTSAGVFLIYLVTVPLVDDHQTSVTLCVFGFICPMIFGMAYLLLPPYVGRTLIDYRLPGIHFGITYLAVGLLVVGWRQGQTGMLFSLGTIVWTAGIAIFVGSLVATVVPPLFRQPLELIRTRNIPQRSSTLAIVTIAVAIGYLVVGTGVLLVSDGPLEIASVTVSQVSHFYTIGFGMLLIFALGVRLLAGFTHVTPPRPLVWIVLVTGVVAPALLGSALWIQPWFRIGSVLAGIAMSGYLLLVGYVMGRTDRITPGLYGVLLGAIAGTEAIGTTISLAFGGGGTTLLELHRIAILRGFFPLTIVGYAYQFFPVDDVRILETDIPYTSLTIGLLGIGVIIQGIGILGRLALLQSVGIGSSVFGTLGYTLLIIRRFLGS